MPRVQTARRWLKVMEGTYQWFELPAFSGNLAKRVSSRPKGHLADTGLASLHARIASPGSLAGHPLYGALFETAMVCELVKQSSVLATRPAFYHWRSGGGAEIDLILEWDGVLYPFEIKLTASPGRRHAAGIAAFRAAHPHLRVGMGGVISAVEHARWIADDVLALPWNLL